MNRTATARDNRAALGLAQVSDALVICVSEESGAVSLAHDERLEPIRSEKQLAEALGALSARREPPLPAAAKQRPRLRALLPYAAIFGAVVAAWGALALDRTQVVSRIVPLELRDVSDNFIFDPPRVSSVAVELRGSHAELESVPLGGVEAYVELSAATPGVHVYPVVARAPAGIDVVGVRPAGVAIQTRPRAAANAAPVAASASPSAPTAALH